MVTLDGSGKGFKILNFKSIHFKMVLSLPIKVSLKKKKISQSRIESQRKKRKAKGIEINKILLEDSLSLWIQVSNDKFLFCINVNIMKS